MHYSTISTHFYFITKIKINKDETTPVDPPSLDDIEIPDGFGDYYVLGFWTANEEKLKEVLKRAENHCKLQKEKEPLIIRVNGENCYVPKEEILYAENYARKVILHLGERQIAYYAKMGELEEQLGESFFRVHRGYLVNLRAVRSYHTAGVVLKNGEEILMAKSKFQKFEEVYMDFLRNSD